MYTSLSLSLSSLLSFLLFHNCTLGTLSHTIMAVGVPSLPPPPSSDGYDPVVEEVRLVMRLILPANEIHS